MLCLPASGSRYVSGIGLLYSRGPRVYLECTRLAFLSSASDQLYETPIFSQLEKMRILGLHVSKFCLRRMVNGYVTVRKRFVFVLLSGGPAPPEGRGGAHFPRRGDRERTPSAQGKTDGAENELKLVLCCRKLE